MAAKSTDVADVTALSPLRIDEEQGAGEHRRAVGRRRSLPNGRAVMGGLLVAVAAVGTFAAWSGAGGTPSTSYLVSTRDLAPGEAVSAGDVRLEPIDLPANLRAAAFDDATLVEGATALGPVHAGELLQAGNLVKKAGGAATTEISFAIDPSRAVAGRLRPGERVDVLATYGAGESAYTTVVVRTALVIRADTTRSALGGDGSLVISLSLPRATDALALAHAVQAGELTVVRTTGAPTTGGSTTYRPTTSR